ncbi:MAG: hypothetical protein HN730_11775, partial [Bdellovibrionales bacterium]|nr:hypothetical protein [Bdellovibrionales bacterium]
MPSKIIPAAKKTVPPIFHLILCRNVLIYFDDQLSNQVLHLLHDSLANRGHL